MRKLAWTGVNPAFEWWVRINSLTLTDYLGVSIGVSVCFGVSVVARISVGAGAECVVNCLSHFLLL